MPQFRSNQFVPVDIRAAWEFFSSPHNLSTITPKRMNFRILSSSGDERIHDGQIIRYRVTVLPLMRVDWETEIIDVNEFVSFTDVQKRGPYSKWIHKHSFVEAPGGVEIIDEVDYEVPLGLAGRIIDFLLVSGQVKKIFQYRAQVLRRLWG